MCVTECLRVLEWSEPMAFDLEEERTLKTRSLSYERVRIPLEKKPGSPYMLWGPSDICTRQRAPRQPRPEWTGFGRWS